MTSFRAFVDNLNTELYAAKRSRTRAETKAKFQRQLVKQKLTDFVSVQLKSITKTHNMTHSKIRTFHATVVVDEKAMQHAGRLDGFWLLVTNLNAKVKQVYVVPAEDIIIPYRNKWLIESAFRDLKSFIDVKPIHVWTPIHVKAHYTCCVLSHLINGTLTKY